MRKQKQLKDYDKYYKTNTCGVLEVLEKQGKKFKVRFLETGYETLAEIGNVLAGKVLDPIYKKQILEEWKPCHEVYENNAGQEFVVFAKCRHKRKVRFTGTGYTTEVFDTNAKAGKVNDPYAISVLGVGYMGEFKRLPYWRQAKQLWSNMMKRCYSPKDTKGYYGRCFVAERWHCFANFMEDLPSIDNFDLWLIGGKDENPKYNLDKDLRISDNKVYSKEACMFVTEFENKSAGAINARMLDKLNGRYSA